MFNPSFYIAFLYFVSWQLSVARSECLITYPDDKKLMPRYTRPRGGNIQMPYNSFLPIPVADGEVIDVYCLTKIKSFPVDFRSGGYYNTRASIANLSSTSLVCQDGTLRWKPEGSKLLENKLSCEPIPWTLYYNGENQKCDVGQFSYTLGATFNQTDVLPMAQLCYDYATYMPKILSYIFGPSMFLHDHNALANYEFHSLVQGHFHQAYLHDYEGFLDIAWWKNLRVGNWRRMMEALDKQATSNSFEITSGISGVAPVPHEDCSKTRHLHAMVKGVNVTVPEYVWTYIKPHESVLDSFVVIGYNSPYFEFFPRDTTVLCQDICHTIDWLKDVRYSFNKTTAGILFCCDPEEIRKGNLLKGFPPAPPAPTAPPALTAPTAPPASPAPTSPPAPAEVENRYRYRHRQKHE